MNLMNFKKNFAFTITGLIPVLFLSACRGAAIQPQDNTTTEISETYFSDDKGRAFPPLRIIKQRETSFGDNGCGGAAGLMALQAAGCLTDYDTEEEYLRFWQTVPQNKDATKGYNGNGIWNPTYCDWLGTFSETQRIEGFLADDIKDYIDEGNVAIVLVSLGETGQSTHWITVTGWKISEGLLMFDVADPWSGALHEYTSMRLQKRMDEGAKRKGDFGAGYETDGVLVKVREE